MKRTNTWANLPLVAIPEFPCRALICASVREVVLDPDHFLELGSSSPMIPVDLRAQEFWPQGAREVATATATSASARGCDR